MIQAVLFGDCKLTVGVSMSVNGRLSFLALWQTGTVQGVP